MQTETQTREMLNKLKEQRIDILAEINRKIGLLDGQISALEYILQDPVNQPEQVENSES